MKVTINSLSDVKLECHFKEIHSFLSLTETITIKQSKYRANVNKLVFFIWSGEKNGHRNLYSGF